MRTPTILFSALGLASVLLLSAASFEAPKAFEYKIIPVRMFEEGETESRDSIAAAEVTANKMAGDGWELMGTETLLWEDVLKGHRDLTVVLTLRRVAK